MCYVLYDKLRVIVRQAEEDCSLATFGCHPLKNVYITSDIWPLLSRFHRIILCVLRNHSLSDHQRRYRYYAPVFQELCTSDMHLLNLYPAILAILALLEPVLAARKPSNSVILSSVKSLTLRANSKTSHRRVSAIPQLKCVGGDGKGLYEIDVMRCQNQGSDYDDGNIQWTCTANLPEEFKLGSTDVICEGYDSPDDPYILKGSCGVEYKLMLTEKGEGKYGNGGPFGGHRLGKLDLSGLLFGIVFCAVAGWILYSIYVAWRAAPQTRRPPGNGGFWGNGWGGGGDGGDPFDPPPPYPGKQYSTSRRAAAPAQEGWRPGFWSGALGGAAAGYLAGNRGGAQQAPPRNTGWFGSTDNGWGAGPSSRPVTRSSSGSNTRHESTGFGSTSRR